MSIKKKEQKKLAMSHMIFLTEEQRYDLFNGVKIEAVGILTQIDFVKNYKNHINQEVFCKYFIDCEPENPAIRAYAEHYEIHIPMEYDAESFFAAKNFDVVYIHDILNKKDGGKEMIFFEKAFKNSKNNLDSYHKVEIKDIKFFDESMMFSKIS